MPKYRKKPVVIEAERFTVLQAELPFAGRGDPVSMAAGMAGYYIETLEGRMKVEYGDWVIRGVKGEFYPCRADIFEATYEASRMTDLNERAREAAVSCGWSVPTPNRGEKFDALTRALAAFARAEVVRARVEGWKDGAREYAVWRDGRQLVGVMERELEDVLSTGPSGGVYIAVPRGCLTVGAGTLQDPIYIVAEDPDRPGFPAEPKEKSE